MDCAKCLTRSFENKKLLFTIYTDENEPALLCKNQKNEIIDNLLKYQTIVNAVYSENDRIKIIFLPHRFDIIIKNGVAYFYIKGE